MSAWAVLPVAEIVSLVAGLAAASVSFAVMPRKRSKASDSLSDFLNASTAWKQFEKQRLKDILADHEVSEAEWREILNKIDMLVTVEPAHFEPVENRTKYLSRSEKSKKMLISEILKERASEIAA